MESTSLPGRIQYSASTMSELHAVDSKVTWKSRGDVPVKGKGLMETFFLTGYEDEDQKLMPTAADLDTSMFVHKTPRKSKVGHTSGPGTKRGSMNGHGSGSGGGQGMDTAMLLQLFAQMQASASTGCPFHNTSSSSDGSSDGSGHGTTGPKALAGPEPSDFYDVRLVVSRSREGVAVSDTNGQGASSGGGAHYSLMRLMCAFPTRAAAESAVLAGVGNTNTVNDVVETLQLSRTEGDEDERQARLYADDQHTRRIMGTTKVGQLVKCGLVQPVEQEGDARPLITLYCVYH